MPTTSRALASRDLETGYENIDPTQVLFGVEYSFQDRELVNEPGRTTVRTEYKAKKLEAMLDKFLELHKTNRTEAIVKDTSHNEIKPGYQFKIPGEEVYTINMEPVTVEFNTSPKLASQIREASTPIFEAAESVGLKPYVNPAAERSGMGHIHVGATYLKDSPFYKNPNLLRNMLVYYHKHPSLLYGFAEAYDIGDKSNIETYHSRARQLAFKKAIAEYDEWYARALKGEDNIEKGLQELLRALKKNESEPNDFFKHYRFINLQHLKIFAIQDIKPHFMGKLTVEFRGFRPQKSPEHAQANTQLLLDIMETLSAPGYLEKFETVNEAAFSNFWTAGKIKSDWLEVKKFIKHDNPYSDEMLEEAVLALEQERPTHKLSLGHIKEAKLYEAYSVKTDKGSSFELRIPAKDERMPKIKLLDVALDFELISLDDGKYWITRIDTKKLKIQPTDLYQKPIIFKVLGDLIDSTQFNCRKIMNSFIGN